MKRHPNSSKKATVGIVAVGCFSSELLLSRANPVHGADTEKKEPIKRKFEMQDAKRLDINFKETNVFDILSLIEQSSGLKVVFDTGLSGKITIKMEDATPEETVKMAAQ